MKKPKSMPSWFKTKKGTGFSISLQTPFVKRETEKFLKELGNPYGVFIGYGSEFEYGRLYLMNNFKGNRTQIRDKMIEIYSLNEFGRIMERLQEKIIENIQIEINKLPEDERSKENIDKLISQFIN